LNCVKIEGKGWVFVAKKIAEARRRNGAGGKGFDHQVIN
jgi:hypothetical protein